MSSATKKRTIRFEYLIVFCFEIMLLILLLGSIFRESPVFDELIHVPAGYQFLTKHDFSVEPFNPPFTRELVALPMLFSQTVLHDPILLYPRLVVVFFTLCLGIIVYFFAKKLYGVKAGIFALFLYTFNPEILAHGHYAMTDLISTFFFILSLFVYFIWRKRMNYQRVLLFALVAGFAMAAKFTNLVYLSLSLGTLIILDKKFTLVSFAYWKNKTLPLFIFFSVSLLAMWSTYFFTFEPALGYRLDPNRAAIQLAKANPLIDFALHQPLPLGSYLSTIKQVLRTNYTTDFVKESVFFGNYSRDGFYGFFLFAILLIKTPLPFLFFILVTLIYFRNKNKNSLVLLTPLTVIFATTFFTHVLLVLRYILPVVPLLIIYVSQISNLPLKKPILSFCFFALSFWYLYATLLTHPHYLSYVNELIGQKNAYKYLAEGNVDLGQGLFALADYQKKHKITNLQLAYMGTAMPSRYGIQYERLKDFRVPESKPFTRLESKNHVVAISITCWYFCGYYKNPMMMNKQPVDVVGGSILIFK